MSRPSTPETPAWWRARARSLVEDVVEGYLAHPVTPKVVRRQLRRVFADTRPRELARAYARRIWYRAVALGFACRGPRTIADARQLWLPYPQAKGMPWPEGWTPEGPPPRV